MTLAASVTVGLVLAVSALGAASAWSAEEPVMVVRDDAARAIVVPAGRLRLVSLLPSLTEIICALDACDRLVATDRYSNWPAEAAALPKAGSLDDAQIETIVAQRPDLVLVGRSDRVTARLTDLGLTTVAIDTEHYADIAHGITLIGKILRLDDNAVALNARLDAAVRRVATSTAARHRERPPRVYFEVDATPYAAGPDSFIGELLTRLGALNIVGTELGAFPKLNPEYVVREDPDVIFCNGAEAPRLSMRPGWGTIRAVRERRLCTFPAAVYDTIVRPGPRVAQGMRALADCLDREAPEPALQ